MVRGREVCDLSIVIVAGEAGQAAHLAEAAGVEHQIDTLATGEFAATALAHDPGIRAAGGEAGVRDTLERLHLIKHWSPAAIARRLGGRACCAGGRCDGRHDLPGDDACADLKRGECSQTSGERRSDGGLHLHGADHHQGLAGRDNIARPCG